MATLLYLVLVDRAGVDLVTHPFVITSDVIHDFPSSYDELLAKIGVVFKSKLVELGYNLGQLCFKISYKLIRKIVPVTVSISCDDHLWAFISVLCFGFVQENVLKVEVASNPLIAASGSCSSRELVGCEGSEVVLKAVVLPSAASSAMKCMLKASVAVSEPGPAHSPSRADVVSDVVALGVMSQAGESTAHSPSAVATTRKRKEAGDSGGDGSSTAHQVEHFDISDSDDDSESDSEASDVECKGCS